jgi:serine/threonine-protein kinase RsbW
MLPLPQRTDVTLESRLDSITIAENICTRVAESAGFGEDDCYRISMAVREGVVNAFHWGNEEQSHKKIFMSVHVQDHKLIVSITDEGRGFDLSDVPDPLAEGNLLKTSGRGIFLMRAFMDEWMVARSTKGGAMLVMAKRLPCNENSPTGPHDHE